MSCAEWINLGILVVAFWALAIALIQPRLAHAREKKDQVDRLKKRGSLYLDVFQIKLEKELSIFNRSGVPSLTLKTFEKDNQINYHALENILQDATILKHDEYMMLMEFVRDCKTAGKMKEGVGVKDFLNRIRNENLRKVFPEGRVLNEAIEEATKPE